ncbi:MAG TPA: hypothetical protein VJ733_10975 [Candidatus Binatia bacterium]|nr:hypothetical protein [Candidatus Binatia bacterium]
MGDDTRENLILIGGRKANPIERNFQRLEHSKLSFDLRDGVIYDKQKHIVLVPQYAAGQERTLANLVADYGLISYTDNPFGKSTKILHLAGIRGFGTLAAAIALVDPRPIRTIEKILTRLIRRHASQPKNLTVEILVRVSVSRGRARRDSLAIEKIKVSHERTSRAWESEAYGQLKPVSPHGLYIDAVRSTSKAPIIRARIDNEEITFTKSSDRMKTIYFLAKQAKEDYLDRSGNQGWMSAVQLAESLWQIKLTSGGSELIGEVKKEVSEAIRRWANDLKRQGKLLLPDNVTVDHQYINSEILIFDSDIKKKVVDLIHMINHEQKSNNNTGFQLIESKPALATGSISTPPLYSSLKATALAHNSPCGLALLKCCDALETFYRFTLFTTKPKLFGNSETRQNLVKKKLPFRYRHPKFDPVRITSSPFDARGLRACPERVEG